MRNLINQISTATGLTPPETEGVVCILLENPGITSNELIRATGIPKETLRVFKQSISSLLEATGDDEILFKKDANEKLKQLKLNSYSWSLIGYEDQQLTVKLEEIRKKHNLEPNRSYDQFFATPKTTVSKAKIMQERGQVSGKRIALLGDDDLLSIALGLYDLDYQEIVVFDIDQQLLSVIKTITEELGLKNIRTQVFDARKDLNRQEVGKYDVVVTDPPYTRNGVDVFLNTAVQLLKKEGYIFLYYGNSFKSPEKTLKVQDVILSYSLEIQDKIDKFARYYGAESIGSASSLYILEATPFTQSKEQALLRSEIYTFEDRKEEKFPYVDHYTIKVYNVPSNLLSSKKALTKAVDDFCTAHRLKVVDTKVTQFKGKGVSLTLVLSTSNLSVHTWPEHNAVHMDLVTCSPIYNKEFLGETVSKLFSTKTVEVRKVE